jgi:DNA-directed RNA polymerase subunit RPC12/RpoP
MLVGFSSTFYRCTTCGNELEQKINGVIKYILADKNTKIQITEHNGHGNKG